LLSVLGATSFVSASRGMNKRRAADNLHKALIAARQRACVDAAQTQFICFNVWSGEEKNTTDPVLQKTALTPMYVVCRALGRITYTLGSDLLGDEFTPLDKLFGTLDYSKLSSYSGRIRLFNLTQNNWSDAYMGVVPQKGHPLYSATATTAVPPLNDEAQQMVWCFVLENNRGVNWKVGDVYGIEVGPPASLPQNIFFTALGNTPGSDNRLFIRFSPDGQASGGVASGNGSVIPSSPISIGLMTLDNVEYTSIDVESSGRIRPPRTWTNY
jgi:hypothetical protein